MCEKIRKESAELTDGELNGVAGGIGLMPAVCSQKMPEFYKAEPTVLTECGEFQPANGIPTTQHTCKNCIFRVPMYQ